MQIKRFYTNESGEPYSSCCFAERSIETPDSREDHIQVPVDWSFEAASSFSGALFPLAACPTQAIEENTMPSWLWRRRALSGGGYAPETSAEDVLNRVTGSAAYHGWKKGLLSHEEDARAFFDEVRHLLIHRFIAIEPECLKSLGAGWAYGEQALEASLSQGSSCGGIEDVSSVINKTSFVSINNSMVDALISDSKPLSRSRWRSFLRAGKRHQALTVRFEDTAAEWSPEQETLAAPRLMINLFRFHRDGGNVDAAGLRHAVRLGVLLLELHYESLTKDVPESRPLAIGFGNMAALLMSLGLPFGSQEARSTAAALGAIVTAEATAVSAELAEILGPCPAFAGRREAGLRALRNHRRSAYGEKNDYERLSIVPFSLNVEDGADLVLIAAARRAWDEALERAQKHGLRHLQVTDFFSSPSLQTFIECSSQGAEPDLHLVRHHAEPSEGGSVFRRTIHPALSLALEASGCRTQDTPGIIHHVMGYGTLKAAPGINHARLRERGFDTQALARVESYLPNVNDIRTVFTPWILGEYFSRYILRVDPKNLHDPRFDMLRHLGFSKADVAAANAFCFGYGTPLGAEGLTAKAQKLFAPENTTFESQIRMAAAVQSFVMGDVRLILPLPAQCVIDERSALLLSGWRQGLKSMSLYFEGISSSTPVRLKAAASKIHEKLLRRKPSMPAPSMPASALSHIKAASHMMTPRAAKPRASTRATSIKRQDSKAGSGTKRGFS